MDKEHRFHRIEAIELLDLPPAFDAQSYHLEFIAGGVKHKTTSANRRKKEVSGPKWTVDLDLSKVSEDERFKVEVYSLRKKNLFRKAKSQCFGFYEGSIRDILIGRSESNDTIDIPMTSKLSFPNTSLRIFREDVDYSTITRSAGEDQDADTSAALQSGPSNTIDPRSQNASDLSVPQPEAIPATSVEDDWAITGKGLQETAKPKDPSEWISKLTDGIDTVKDVIDLFKDVHPAASIAWGFVSICVNILKQQTERDETVLQLYKVMIETYKAATDDRQLWEQERLKPIYKLLFQTTNECRMLIQGYTSTTRLKHVFSLDVTRKAKEFIQGFEIFRMQLDSGVAKDALVVTLGVRATVEVLVMRSLLQGLNPEKQLDPKPACMPGTRMETLKFLMSWIAKCGDSVLWCSGLAGTGKSSLVSTLYKLLSSDESSRDRIAAFIRYDRNEYKKSSGLIACIAYSLGMFDRRIGNAIAKALEASPAAAGLPPSESRTKFRLLLQKPLETIQELQDEGPLVVIIDGLDESDVSKELLEVLADGFGCKLPFMRLIISSRPEDKITRVFKDHPHLHRYPLDTFSAEVEQDIRHFIQQSFASIDDESIWGTHNKEDVITSLAGRASGLFIWAATVCSFLCGLPCLRRLNVLLETTIPANAMEALTILYQTALDTIVSEVPGTKEDIQQCIRAVLGALIVCESGMSTDILTELVLQEGDPSAQLIIDKLGSVVKKSGWGSDLELIHKSFDDFLQDHGRCGHEWFIDVKEHEKELAQRCVLYLALYLEEWMPRGDHLEEDWAKLCRLFRISGGETTTHFLHADAAEYALNIFMLHPDVLVDLTIDAYCSLFEHYFFLWVAILCPPERTGSSNLQGLYAGLLKIFPLVNAEATDQSLRTYIYHAFSFLERVIDSSHPSTSVYKGMSFSPSDNLVCRDWRKGCGTDTPLDKERLLALMPWATDTDNPWTPCWSMSAFQGSQYIQSELMETTGQHPHRSVLFNVDTGRIMEPTSQSTSMLCFPDLQIPSLKYDYKEMDASFQIVRLVHQPLKDHEFKFSNPIQYEVIKRQDTHDSSLDSGDGMTMLISIVNTRTSQCDNYLVHGWTQHGCSVVQYAHGLFIIDKDLGLTLKVESGTAGCKEWISLDGYVNIHGFTVLEDGSRLVGWMVAKDTILLREWETSTGTLCWKHIYGFPGLDINWTHIDENCCQMSPDGSKVAITGTRSMSWLPWEERGKAQSQTCILGIMPEPQTDITDPMEIIENVCNLAWFPDSERIAYFQNWQPGYTIGSQPLDLVVQHLANRVCTTIYRWYSTFLPPRILISADGSRLITQDQRSFRTWDISDL